MHIALGCDHRGLELKQTIIGLLSGLGHDYEDFGCYSAEPVDYPDIAQRVAEAVISGESDHGILICGSGIGMSIAANNDANILCLGEETIKQGLALDVVKAYLSSTFEGGRHSQRVEKIHSLEAASLDNK